MDPNKLSVDEIAALLASLEMPQSQERRLHPRTPVRGRLRAFLRLPGQVPLGTTVRDLSRSGLGMSAASPVEPGQRVEIVVEPVGCPPISAICRITACRPDANADLAAIRYILGLQFIQISRELTSPAPQRRPAS